MLHLTLITHDKNSRQVACFFVSLAQNMNDKRLGCLKIVHAHTGQKLVVFCQQRGECCAELLNISVDVAWTTDDVHELLPVWCKLYGNRKARTRQPAMPFLQCFAVSVTASLWHLPVWMMYQIVEQRNQEVHGSCQPEKAISTAARAFGSLGADFYFHQAVQLFILCRIRSIFCLQPRDIASNVRLDNRHGWPKFL